MNNFKLDVSMIETTPRERAESRVKYLSGLGFYDLEINHKVPWLIPMSEINFLLRTYGHPAEVPRQFWNVSAPVNPHDVPFLEGLMFEPLEVKGSVE